MTSGTTNSFATIGRTYPSDAFEPLYRASLVARAQRRVDDGRRTWDGSPRKVWRGSGETITVPIRLPV